MPWQPLQLDDPRMHSPDVVTMKDKLFRRFGWVRDKYPTLAPEGRTDEFDVPLASAVLELQHRAGLKITLGKLGGGVATYEVKVYLGLIAKPPTGPSMTFLSVTGTGGAWDNGFGWDVGVRLNQAKIRHQPVGYNTSAFLMGDVSHSFLDALNDGAAELLRLSLPDRGPKVWDGYSMGASVVTRALNQWPVDRAGEIKAVIQQGDPTRPAGRTLLGNDPGGQGISDERPPSWVLDRYYSFAIDGDMYPCADGLLPQLYQVLVRAEATPEFAMYLFQMLVTSAGSALLGTATGSIMGAAGFGSLAPILGMVTPGAITSTTGPPNLLAMVMNIPAIVQTIMTALKFMVTGAHGHYGDQPVFGGLTGVDKAVQIVNQIAA